ncbi:hypothetical protein APE_1275a [Aeropyrum pernix K1]|uniref:Uncharacterized protein n=1 Tax=Aeropyrum pernix (strain ATCC 700893 / DSM 11879 / JCM 9820 / NBRC 100138 / K1) TaxID=272557 RepID=Q05E19_AERPE|nr:hypothetical protein [Aeropyrum pernix]BAF34782.1 hypothetical protein APE_1275a [Aeropyrum pernix K1]
MIGENAVYAILSGAIALILSLKLVSWWIETASRRRLVGRDMNKYDKPEVAEAGGIWAVVAGAFGLLMLEALLWLTRVAWGSHGTGIPGRHTPS